MTESLLSTQTTTTPSVDENTDFLAELTKPGAKFDRTKYQTEAEMYQAIARGKYEADLHINVKNREMDTLSSDYKRLRDEYNAGPKLQELIDRLAAAKDTSSSTNTQTNEEQNKDSAFDPSQLDSLVENKFQEIETKRKQQQNWNTVKERLQEQFGERFPEILASQTQKLGLTADKVDDLARTSPSAFFRLMGLDEQKTETFQSPPRSSQTQTGFAPTTNVRKWSHYKALLKTQPNLFSDPKAHNQMMADIKAIGEKAFYDVQ